MYPSGELKELAQRKMLIQARIAVRRYECARAAAELAKPLALIDRGISTWQRISPLVKLLAVPGGFFLSRVLKGRSGGKGPRKRGKLGMIMTVLPLILRGVKMAKQFQAAHQAHKSAVPGASMRDSPAATVH